MKLEKTRVIPTRHVKYAIRSVYGKGDWAAMVDCVKPPMLSTFDGSTFVVDVRTVDIKGKSESCY